MKIVWGLISLYILVVVSSALLYKLAMATLGKEESLPSVLKTSSIIWLCVGTFMGILWTIFTYMLT